MKMSKVSPKMLKKAKERLVKRWNEEVACNKPATRKIREHKRAIRRMRKDRHAVVDGQMELIKETQEQERVVREYLNGSDETDSVKPEIF